MAKKSLIAKEKRREIAVKRKSQTRNKLKETIKSASDYDVRADAILALHKLPRNSSACRLTRRCRVCGRPRGVYRKFAMCRIHLREFLMNGDVPGGRKASW